MSVYLDYNATTPLREEAKIGMLEVMGPAYNASSVHSYGRKAKSYLDEARDLVATLVNANSNQIIFTSGGTEANAMIMHSASCPLISSIEHEAIIQSSHNPTFLEVNGNGQVNLNQVEKKILETKPDIISVMWANNETGVIQPINEIAEIANNHNVHIHCDAVQAVGKIEIDFKFSGLDSLAISSHKIGGPSGVGALVVSESQKLQPIIRGGGQERGYRSGTENLLGIVGFGAAAQKTLSELKAFRNIVKQQRQFEEKIKNNLSEIIIIGESVERLPNTTCLYMPHLSSEAQVIALDLEGFAVSAGSACSSGKVKESHVLKAMGADWASRNSIRISSGWQNSENDLDNLAQAYIELYKRSYK